MDILDAQVHAWLPRDDPNYPWWQDAPLEHFETEIKPDSAEDVLQAMGEASVDRALIVVPRLYGWDNSYAIDSARRHPDRFAVVARIDPVLPDPAGRLRDLMSVPEVVGIRLRTRPGFDWSPDGPFEALLKAAEDQGVVVCGGPGVGDHTKWAAVATRFPDLALVLDHTGLEAPPQTNPPPGVGPFDPLPDVLRLSSYDNVSVKLTGMPALSSNTFPFIDVRPAVLTVVAEFGEDRVMWGSDFSRTSPLHTYVEGTRYLAEINSLTDSQKEQIYGGTLQRVYAWPPTPVKESPHG